MWRKNVLLIVLLAMVALPASVSAQRVVADVKVILDKLPIEKREKMENFAQKLTDYINQVEWCEDRYGVDLPVTLQLFLNDASVNYEERYRATLLISNNKDVQFYDKRWLFNYDNNEPLMQQEGQFHPLTSVIDFYVYLILGFEFDKYGPFQGTPYLKKAADIMHQARFSKFITGWDEREDLINSILSDEAKPFRQALDEYFLGISYSQEDFNKTRQHCKKAIDLIAKLISEMPRYEPPKQFINGHRTEIINIFKDDPAYKTVFETLVKIDPDHASDYKPYIGM